MSSCWCKRIVKLIYDHRTPNPDSSALCVCVHPPLARSSLLSLSLPFCDKNSSGKHYNSGERSISQFILLWNNIYLFTSQTYLQHFPNTFLSKSIPAFLNPFICSLLRCHSQVQSLEWKVKSSYIYTERFKDTSFDTPFWHQLYDNWELNIRGLTLLLKFGQQQQYISYVFAVYIQIAQFRIFEVL